MNTSAILMDRWFPVETEQKEKFFKLTLEKIRLFTSEIYIMTEHPGDKLFENLKTLTIQSSNDFLRFLERELAGKTVMILSAYSPLFDKTSCMEMLEEHIRNVFDFTYPDNLPLGLLPEIIDSGISEFILQTIPDNTPMFRLSIKETFERDISSYDCNIFISESRLIKHRVNFIPDSLNDYLVTSSIIEKFGCNFTIMQLEARIENSPDIIRKRPTFFEIELNTERESGDSTLSSRLKRNSEIKPRDFDRIMESLASFSQSPMVSLGLFGESFLHPSIGQILATISKYPDISFLIESRCLFLNMVEIENALKLKNVRIIFDISYSTGEGFDNNKKPLNALVPANSLNAIEEKIKSLKNRDRIYVQFTRTTLNETELYRFYEKWRDFADRIIIKKPDTFGGELEIYRVVDLSPLKRFPCLHLKHDMVILADGTVPLCRQDYEQKSIAGNILTDGIESCWEKLGSCYQAQWSGNYDNPPLCKNCDEWWVFNN